MVSDFLQKEMKTITLLFPRFYVPYVAHLNERRKSIIIILSAQHFESQKRAASCRRCFEINFPKEKLLNFD